MTPQQPLKLLAQKNLPTGLMILVQYPDGKKKWVWSNKLPKEAKDSWNEHLAR
jgi:hypothetical protein